jgi:hypothetical protein
MDILGFVGTFLKQEELPESSSSNQTKNQI